MLHFDALNNKKSSTTTFYQVRKRAGEGVRHRKVWDTEKCGTEGMTDREEETGGVRRGIYVVVERDCRIERDKRRLEKVARG